MVPPALLIVAAVAGYFLIGVGVISGLARMLLTQNTGEEPPTIQATDWLVLALLAAFWPIVLAVLAILSLAAVILSRLCRN